MNKLIKTWVCAGLFVGVWVVVTWKTMRETRVDVDLGIAPANLPVEDAAVWSLPLATGISLGVFLIGSLVVRLGHLTRRVE